MSGAAGRLIYLIGPSGAGKDSLIDHVRARIGDAPVRFARRYVTRPAGAGGERHVALTPAEFERLRAAGGFALHWTANGLRYGIGVDILDWLAADATVVVNGSRAGLADAEARFPGRLHPVLIEVSPQRLAERLLARGRESAAEIQARLARAAAVPRPVHSRLRVIRNDGRLDEAGAALLRLLAGGRAAHPGR
ncbi:phosphonate metabolism protein/1,5-bisphosphokinase (PRPP-forming) PhnN [Pseudothauera nasutitermitis]|uniref:Ribose 1,5-bisphosphate phosphokinase PhnN n=1 Tax=Pseudothauera nasutitermitis TaxID=2565930 RepID=A0A4S4AV94_9RHOO|nr:phosphonate metabolism protein/1,5-bisphosphokinase (PRPP-forming) PhnN [Pseudothauera nasutitermitis]THF63939.1 phosphonate metabolism protein/1,5-bisphosphokinase (PRPP-forming) PhnN [Pseudothauera nasutitermitis]